jgi:hypothetical protein
MRKKERVTLHFDLSHCPKGVEFILQAGDGKHYALTSYQDAPGKLEAHRRQNKALSLIAPDRLHQITHFVEDAELHADAISLRSVVYPSVDDHPLPELALVFIHIPTEHRRRAIREMLAKGTDIPHHANLARYGVSSEAVNAEELEEVRLAADHIKPPCETAKTIVFHHPEIGTVNPVIAQIVFDRHVRDTNDFLALVQYIENNGPETDNCWYQKTYSTWINPETGEEEPIEANDELKGKDEKKIQWPKKDGKSVIPLYDLTDEYTLGRSDKGVIGAATPAVHQVLRDTKNDEALNGLLWTKQTGTTQKTQTNVQPTPSGNGRQSFAARAFAGATKGWTIKNQTSSYGLDLYPDQLTYDYGSKKLSFPIKNWPNRYLGAYVQFFKEDGTEISRDGIPNWGQDMSFVTQIISDICGDIIQPSKTKSLLDSISSGNQVFGVPFPTNPVTLGFIWPEEATKADVLLGGLGVAAGFRDWDTDVDVFGTVYTGIMNYGITALSMALTVYVVNPFISRLSKDVLYVLYAIAGEIGVCAIALGAGTYDTNGGKWILSKMATKVGSIIFGELAKASTKLIKKAVEKFGEEAKQAIDIEMTEFVGGVATFTGEVEAEEAAEAIPYVGWVLKAASVAADVATLTATTIECLASPATYKLEILHTMDLKVTVSPDPKHGTDKQAPIWPMVSDHYVITVAYPNSKDQEGGTTYVKTGPMPGKHDDPIEVTFEGIPAGGKCQVTANIYSDTNWLAGRWDSGWINADPDEKDQLAVSGNIVENLVPLTTTMTYSQKQRVIYDAQQQKHLWGVMIFSIEESRADDLDDGTVSPDLRRDFQDNGNTLSPDKDISITTESQGSEWELVDNGTGIHYHIVKVQVDGSHYELKVQDTTHEFPKLPDVIHDCSDDGQKMCDRINIIINNKEYQLGYTWRASGQNLPLDYDDIRYNGQMYAFQSISTLGEPEDAIIEPSRGFTQQPYLAFDQFGLTPLFDLPVDTYRRELNKGGSVSPALAKEFANYTLPPDTQIQVVTRDKEWLIGVPDQDPLYDLRVTTKTVDSQQQEVIDVYSYPIPSLDNFYLDPRPHAAGGYYHLRGVQFALGKSTFDYSSDKSWGAFSTPHLKDIAVHPHGYVVGVDYDNHKMFTLKLPAQAVDEKDAPLAMPLSGEGLREGLMKEPVAMTITLDSRILILEQGNRRIQAFDVKGNPVQCFSGEVTTLDAKFIGDLDARRFNTDLVQAFQMNVMPSRARLFTSDLDSVAALNDGKVDAQLVQAFKNRFYDLPDDSSKINVITTKQDELWLIQDLEKHATYDVRVIADALFIFYSFDLGIDVKALGQEWTIRDTTNAMTFDVTKPQKETGSTDLTVQQLISTMALRGQEAGRINYLDVAVEDKGYIYVLSSLEKSADTPVYQLDIYNPDGSPLLDEPQTGVNAAKLTVDKWRSLFTLNYDKILGPGGRTEPGVSTWIPSSDGAH